MKRKTKKKLKFKTDKRGRRYIVVEGKRVYVSKNVPVSHIKRISNSGLLNQVVNRITILNEKKKKRKYKRRTKTKEREKQPEVNPFLANQIGLISRRLDDVYYRNEQLMNQQQQVNQQQTTNNQKVKTNGTKPSTEEMLNIIKNELGIDRFKPGQRQHFLSILQDKTKTTEEKMNLIDEEIRKIQTEEEILERRKVLPLREKESTELEDVKILRPPEILQVERVEDEDVRAPKEKRKGVSIIIPKSENEEEEIHYEPNEIIDVIAEKPVEGKPTDQPIQRYFKDIIGPQGVEQIKIMKEIFNQSGQGLKKISEKGLSEDEINKVMKKYKYYYGTIASDEISSKIKPVIKKTKPIGFIMNLDKRSKPGSHWIAIFISPKSASVEYYDSFGREPQKHVTKQLKDLVDSLNLPVLYKFKVNKVKHQTDNSNLCGFHSMKFLIQRFKNIPFSTASGYDDRIKDKSKKYEAEIRKLINQKPFSYI
jgi:hypothetical protein